MGRYMGRYGTERCGAIVRDVDEDFQTFLQDSKE